MNFQRNIDGHRANCGPHVLMHRGENLKMSFSGFEICRVGNSFFIILVSKAGFRIFLNTSQQQIPVIWLLQPN